MATIQKRNKAMSVNPLKTSQTVGAAIAFLGIDRSIPMMHGSQGCTAFGKVFFVRHFREPVPLQTTAMDQASSVLGADENVVEGLATVCEKSSPALIGLPTTGLAETQGCDILRNVREFRQQYPQHADVAVIPVNTPDFSGSFETGYAAAVTAMIDELVPRQKTTGRHRRQVNVLVSSALSIGDVEWLKETIEAFGLAPVVLPDLSESLDGHLTDRDFSPVSVGGTPVQSFATLGDSVGTLVIGDSLGKAADLLAERTKLRDERFTHLMGLSAPDRLLMTLSSWSGVPVPESFSRQRSQLQDAMLDTHFMIGASRIAIAADPDLLLGMAELVAGMGGRVVAAVAPSYSPVLKAVPTEVVQIGDLEDLEKSAVRGDAELLISNSHAADSATRLGIPLIRTGFPQYDKIGGYTRQWCGYRGTRQTLFDLANELAHHREHALPVFRSMYCTKDASPEASRNASSTDLSPNLDAAGVPIHVA